MNELLLYLSFSEPPPGASSYLLKFYCGSCVIVVFFLSILLSTSLSFRHFGLSFIKLW